MSDEFGIERMQRRCADFAAKWIEWTTTISLIRTCERHQVARALDVEASQAESWRRQEFVTIYRPCPTCARERAERRPEPKPKRKKRK